ncbi:Zinc finger protein ZAT8 [Acorus calamus]|uniref:Zinc finger protein ZAT8 n=1 Tax=Acorus calamus TaxID=4465 RepID=A0AAV9CWT4_ACOCL|nr:Zinc finger protein ZAT8 [Acorus calamus]
MEGDEQHQSPTTVEEEVMEAANILIMLSRDHWPPAVSAPPDTSEGRPNEGDNDDDEHHMNTTHQSSSEAAPPRKRHKNSKSLPYICDRCGTAFASRNALAGHMSWHSRRECDAPDQEAAEALLLLSRADVSGDGEKSEEHKRLFRCFECDKDFDSFQALGGHRASHNNGRRKCEPGRQSTHRCHKCGKCFPSGTALGGHMRAHYDLAKIKKKQRMLSAEAAAVSDDNVVPPLTPPQSIAAAGTDTEIARPLTCRPPLISTPPPPQAPPCEAAVQEVVGDEQKEERDERMQKKPLEFDLNHSPPPSPLTT